MRLAVTGGTGLVGRFVVEEALSRGDKVIVLARHPAATEYFSGPVEFRYFDLTAPDHPDLTGIDAVVHAALDHLPGRYRGGEGDDPKGFRAANLQGLRRVIAAAEEADATRFVFLSSRAVYGVQRPGTLLHEDMSCLPDTLYGHIKLEGEAALDDSDLHAVHLRATGVYGPAGPGRGHKWASLFEQFASGEAIAPRIGTEVHGADLASAVRLALTGLLPGSYNVSDLLLDRHDLLSLWANASGLRIPAPQPATPEIRAAFNAPDVGKLQAAGWRPGGLSLLKSTLRELASRPAA